MEDSSYGWAQILNSYSGNCYRFTKATIRRLVNDKYLEGYGYKVFSQNDEDGIIQEIFARIGTRNKKFVEFGIEKGLENNTHYLLLQGFTGLWVEGNEDYYWCARYNFFPAIKNYKLKIVNSYVDIDNINGILTDNGFTGEIDLLSVDIDGNDYHILNVINVINPRLIVVEYNGKFPPPVGYCMQYDANHRYDNTDNHGASLQAMTAMMEDKGYELVCTNLNGVNAFYVRCDLVKNNFPYEHTATNLYNPLRLGMGQDLLIFKQSKHPSKYFLGRYGENTEKCVLPLRAVNLQLLKANKPKCILWGAGKCGKIVGDFLTMSGVDDYIYCDTRRRGHLNGHKIISYHEMENIYKISSDKILILICAGATLYEMAYRAIAGGIIRECYHVLKLFETMVNVDDAVYELYIGYADALKRDPFFVSE